jgi:hypothetical protein
MTILTIANAVACMANFGKRFSLYTDMTPTQKQGKANWVSLCSDLGGHMIRERVLVDNTSPLP